jgi:hypothetical protein
MSDDKTSLEYRINKLELKVEELTSNLNIERAKADIYRELLIYNTDIKFKPEQPNTIEKIVTEVLHVDIPTKTNKKVVTEVIHTVPVDLPYEKLETDTYNTMNDIPYDKLVTDTYKTMNDILGKIRSSKTFNKAVNDLQKTRNTLLVLIGLEEYKKLCNSHVIELTEIFTEKGFSDKKTETQISKGLSSLEMRLIKYTNYFNSHLAVDDVRKITESLERSQMKTIEYTVFSNTQVNIGLNNYGSVLASMKLNLQRVLFNQGGMKNIIYIANPKSTKCDPFSFYTLDSITYNKRSWTMDCRLEELTTSIRNDLLPYMISTFRELYKDVFGDNDYRVDYKMKCQLTECDCQQLLTNIFLVASNNQLNSLLKTLVRDNSTHIKTEDDKFNIQSDDAMQKRRWSSFCDSQDSVTSQLFDTIKLDEIKQFDILYKTK